MVHTFETDAVAVTMPGLPIGDDESALAALMAGASDELEIPLDDLGGTTMRTKGLTRMVIYDTVPAGAGNSIRIGERFEKIVDAAIKRVSECSCGIDSSCYACLRNYRNQFKHEDLRRQDALDRLMPLLDADNGVTREPPKPTDTAHLSSPWREAIDLADSSLGALLAKLAEVPDVPAPEVGYEVNDGAHTVELAWCGGVLAIVTDVDAARDNWLTQQGWDLLHFDGKNDIYAQVIHDLGVAS